MNDVNMTEDGSQEVQTEVTLSSRILRKKSRFLQGVGYPLMNTCPGYKK